MFYTNLFPKIIRLPIYYIITCVNYTYEYTSKATIWDIPSWVFRFIIIEFRMRVLYDLWDIYLKFTCAD